jgi:hypothetical protein
MERVRDRRDFYVRTIRWDVTWRAHCDEATREELAIVIWKDYSDVVNWNVAFYTMGLIIIDANVGGENVASVCSARAQRMLRGEITVTMQHEMCACR